MLAGCFRFFCGVSVGFAVFSFFGLNKPKPKPKPTFIFYQREGCKISQQTGSIAKSCQWKEIVPPLSEAHSMDSGTVEDRGGLRPPTQWTVEDRGGAFAPHSMQWGPLATHLSPLT